MIIYKAFIRSKMDYGAAVFGSACKTLLGKLEVVQNSALRIVSGALKTSPVVSLRAELSVCSVQDRILENTVRFFYKASYAENNNPILGEVLSSVDEMPHRFGAIGNNKTHAILRAKECIRDWNLPTLKTCPIKAIYPIPPWLGFSPAIYISLVALVLKSFPADILRRLFEATLSQRFENFLHIYTDGSKNDSYSSSAFFLPLMDIRASLKMDGIHSILVAELQAILMALEWVFENIREDLW